MFTLFLALVFACLDDKRKALVAFFPLSWVILPFAVIVDLKIWFT